MRAAVFVAALVGVACLPNPQSVKERRAIFDRGGLEGSVLVKELPADLQRIEAVFDGQFELVGATVSPSRPKRGDRVEVSYYWTAREEPAQDFKVFVHGDAMEGDSRRLHGDHWPADGRYPTGVWRVGDLVKDTFTFKIPSSYGPDRLGLYSGLYRGNDRARVTTAGKKTSTSDNRVLAVEIEL
ncbi:MAG: hypothetical protein HC923_10925 [Myxococcales bacterium]|nr:hypothetical protein [Myxococcales bacterium]